MIDHSNSTMTSTKFYGSFLNPNLTTSNISSIFNLSIDPIENNSSSHYLCTKCLRFPLIEFCKDKEHVKLTCCCFKTKKCTINDLLDEKENLIFINNASIEKFLSDNAKLFDFEKCGYGLFCRGTHGKYMGFNKYYYSNVCIRNGIGEYVINFNDIEIDEIKIDKIVEYINGNNFNIFNDSEFLEESGTNEKSSYINSQFNESKIRLDEEKEAKFKKLIKIIIDDYRNFPNYSHFLNIQNLIYLLNIEDNSEIKNEKENNKKNKDIIKNDEYVVIEYVNISGKIKLFSKKFIQNNKGNIIIEDISEDESKPKQIEFKSEQEFEPNKRTVKIKLSIKDNIFEINMYRMFANCLNLVSINGISKLKNTKIINQKKMFYNCVSLSSIPDFKEWKISKENNYLMFYNCISLAYLPYEEDILKYDKDGFLGLIITKSYEFKNEITIKNVIEDKEGKVNLFGKELIIKNKREEIMVFNGKKDDYGLIACYKDDEDRKKENEITIFNRNLEDRKGKEVEIKIRIITYMKDIISKNELDLEKWNTSNVTNMIGLFFGCESLVKLPNISKWNVGNVTNMNFLFKNCKALKEIPDISEWNVSNVTNISFLFKNCKYLQKLPDISKWNTSKVTNMESLFDGCESLSNLPDISKWNISNVTNISFLFKNCISLKKLPDISKWNINNITKKESLFDGCKSLSNFPDISKWN